MKVVGAELRRVQLPMRAPFRTSWGTEHDRHLLLIRLVGKVDGEENEGWGECAALSAPLYTSEYTAGAQLVIRDHLLPLLMAAADVAAADVARRLAPVQGHPMAKAALEMAVLDAELRAAGTSLATRVGATAAAVDAGVAVGIRSTVAELVDEVGTHLDAGYRRIKLKIEPGWDMVPLTAIRDQFGDIPLQVDANGAYGRGDTGHLARLDSFGLLLIEQPLAADDLLGHAELARHLATPVCLDESITSGRDAAAALELGACSVVCVKPGRVGGYLEAVRIHDLCRDAGIGLWCGGMLETGLSKSANVALAAMPGFTLPGDFPASDRWFATDLTDPLILTNGRLSVPQTPGIGADLLPEVVKSATRSTEWIAGS
jgi:O-succinylbenzoate synthase